MPPFYRDMSQADLEIQYDARGSVADFEAEMARYRELSDSSYAACTVLRDQSYGFHPDERVDVFPAGPNAPVFVFVHGGYWRYLSRRESTFMAKNMVKHGVSVAVVEYTLAPDATLDQIVDQVRRCIAHIARSAVAFGSDPNRLYVGGSSAGAHLAAMACAADWRTAFGLPVDTIKGAVLVSGLYDLEPVRLCTPNTWLHLDRLSVQRNSPIGLAINPNVDVHITWGGFETDEFKRQSADFAQMLSKNGNPVTEDEVEDRNHFDVITDLADRDRALFRRTLSMIVPGSPGLVG